MRHMQWRHNNENVAAKGKTNINFNVNDDLLARIDRYRFKRMFNTRTEAIEFLLEAALKLNPERPIGKAGGKAGDD